MTAKRKATHMGRCVNLEIGRPVAQREGDALNGLGRHVVGEFEARDFGHIHPGAHPVHGVHQDVGRVFDMPRNGAEGIRQISGKVERLVRRVEFVRTKVFPPRSADAGARGNERGQRIGNAGALARL